MDSIDNLRYPIGHYKVAENRSREIYLQHVDKIESLPSNLIRLVDGISAIDATKTYREGGWTVSQVINHLADSHLNAFTRFKLALTEDNPPIKPYFEERWAEMDDAKEDFKASLLILEGLHSRWARLLKGLDDIQLERTFYHPEGDKTFDMFYTAGMYAWHSEHHLAHIEIALKN